MVHAGGGTSAYLGIWDSVGMKSGVRSFFVGGREKPNLGIEKVNKEMLPVTNQDARRIGTRGFVHELLVANAWSWK